MDGSWYSLSNLKCDSDNKISANALVPAGSPWFSGHFPGEPILPGIAQLAMVFDIIKKCYNKGKGNLKIVSFKKIRFKSLIKPEELLDIMVSSDGDPGSAYSFKITAGGNTACSGIIAVKEAD